MRSLLLLLLGTALLVIVIFLLFPGIEAGIIDALSLCRDNYLKYSGVSFMALTLDIVLPVPSSIVMFLNGSVLGAVYGTLLSLSASIVSAAIGFGIGRSSRGLAARFIKEDENQKADILFKRYGRFAILLSRGIPVLSEAVSITSGLRSIGLQRFLLHNLVGYFPVCIVYGIGGSISSGRIGFMIAFATSLAVAACYWLTGIWLSRSEERSNVNERS